MRSDQLPDQFLLLCVVVTAQRLPYTFEQFRRLQRYDEVFHRIIDDRHRIYHSRNTDPDHLDTQRLTVQCQPVVSHTRSRTDSGICNLNRPV